MNKMIKAQNWTGQKLERRELASPAYYFNLQTIIDDICQMRTLLGGEVLQNVGACPLQEMLSRLPEPARFGAITTSRGELNMVAGWDTDHAYVHLPGLTQGLTRAALGVGHRLIIESPAQIAMLIKLRGHRKVQPIMLSVHPSVVGGAADCQIGMLSETLRQAITLAIENGLVIDGLAVMHSRSFDPHEAIATLRGMRALATEISAQTGHRASRLILGEWHDILTTSQNSASYLAEVKAGPADEIIQHTGGASIFQRAGVMVTRVLDIQPGENGPRAVCDAVVRADFHDTPGLANPRNLTRAEIGTERVMLCGSSGRQSDILGSTYTALEVGDFIAFDNMGAYFRGFDPIVALEGKQLPAMLFFEEETENA